MLGFLDILNFMIALFPFVNIPFVSVISVLPLNNQSMITRLSYNIPSYDFKKLHWQSVEKLQVDWLILRFNQWFASYQTLLVRGDNEPEYFAKTDNSPAKIVFAHGFFASALHEISHWCVAGKKRRLLNDFGYWYAPDGRSEAQQRLFEQVEIIPQAIECLLTLMCGKFFQVSQDNLFANFDTSQSTFANDVCQQAIKFWQTGEKLPTDAKFLLKQLQILRPFPLTMTDISQNFQ